jgi:hypothetical protein
MSKLSLLFESPPWLIGVGVILGVVYAAILYYRTKVPWGKNTNYLLATIRALMVTQLTLLLFGPLIRQIKNTKEPPAVVFAIDNSQSIAEIEDSVNLLEIQSEIRNLREDLEAKGYITETRTLDGISDESNLTFNANSSNLNALIQGIQNDYESRNLSNVLLFSDGLYNLGSNPAFHPYNFQIQSIGMGDTTRRPDLNLNALLYNKIAYQGNKFPVIAELFSYNMVGETVRIQIEKGGVILERKQIRISNQNQYDQLEFLLEASEGGMQRYTVSAIPVDGEFIVSNNSKEAYIDIIDGKQKILMVASAPHPDVRAIKSALESNQNYEMLTYIDGINTYQEDKYDAIILHQVPDRRRRYQNILQKIQQEKIPTFFIYGNQSDINAFNELNGAVRILPIRYQKDQVFPLHNPGFGKFLYSPENITALNDFTPVSVPFANFAVLNQSEIMLYQKVGRVNTQKPLLLIQKSNDWSSAVMLGEGMWNWRIQEYAKSQNQEAFDEMISKIIQFLSTKDDKRRFKVYPLKNEYLNSETVVFETEVYNQIYEPTYGHKIELQIKDDENNTTGFSYITSEQNSTYQVNGLENGIFTYEARAVINGNNEIATGSFTIRDLQIETTNLTANHDLLRNVSAQNGGEFYTKNQLDQLRDNLILEEQEFKIYSSESYLAIINMKWGFFVLIIFVSVEWFLRKYNGSY